MIAASALRVRAERRVGELLREREMAKGGNPKLQPLLDDEGLTKRPRTLADDKITHNESSAYQRLAAVPDADFEAARS